MMGKELCLDNCCTGNKNNLEEFLISNKFKFLNQDVIDPIDLEVDKIWHLACPASPKSYQKDPVSTLRTSFLGSLNMLELAKKNGSRILLASTSEIYESRYILNLRVILVTLILPV